MFTENCRRLWNKLARSANLGRIGQVFVQLLIVFGFEEVFAYTPDMEKYEVMKNIIIIIRKNISMKVYFAMEAMKYCKDVFTPFKNYR